MSINQFSIRQLPGSVLQIPNIAGPNAWNFNTLFNESPDGVRTFFTLAIPFVPQKILSFADGIKQTSTGLTPQVLLHPPNTVQFVTAPLSGAVLESTYLIPNAAEISSWIMDEALTGVKNGVNQLFTTFFTYVSGKELLFRNGYKMIRGVSNDYIEVDDQTFKITPAPASTDIIEATYYILV